MSDQGDPSPWTPRDTEVMVAIAAELGGVPIWETELKDGAVEFVRGQIMQVTKTTIDLPASGPVLAIGVEIMEPSGERLFSFAVSLDDLHRALLMAT